MYVTSHAWMSQFIRMYKHVTIMYDILHLYMQRNEPRPLPVFASLDMT